MNEAKSRCRRELRSIEKSLTVEDKQCSDALIMQNLSRLPEYLAAKTVFSFVGMASEPDTASFIADALSRGKRVCVPLCTAPGIMELKEICALSELSPGSFSILEPPVDNPTLTPDEVDFALIPCLGCDRKGFRIGRGGGYYDRFLAAYGGKAALLCREIFIMEHIPVEPHDAQLPIIVSDGGIYRT